MNPRQLRSYIAPAAPATRTPCDGAQPALRVEFGFTPRWYRQHLDIDFSKRWHTDPIYRRETTVAMKRLLNQRFPSLELGGPDPDATPPSLDGAYGALPMALIFGIPAEYYPDNWPAAAHSFLEPQRLRALEAPNLDNNPAFAQINAQIDAIQRASGPIHGYLNWQGVLNTAYRLRGPELFTDLIADPGLAQHLFAVITQTMIAGMQRVYARQRASGVDIRHATVSNCLVNMISPCLYETYLRPCDQAIADAFDLFGVHNCAWNVDPYAPAYSTLPKLGYIDMGLDSDLVRAKNLFPTARRAVMYTPKDLANKPLEQLRADLVRIRRQLGPCDVVMADIDAETPDERVQAFARFARQAAALDIQPQQQSPNQS